MDQHSPAYTSDQMGYPQYQADPHYGSGSIHMKKAAVNQYLNQLNYANVYNQNLMQQQQYQLEAMNQQMNQAAQEKEQLERQLIQQRQFAVQARQRQTSSRQKEMDALTMLTNFQKSIGGERSNDPFSMFDNSENINADLRRDAFDYRNRHQYNDYYPPPSRNKYEKPPSAQVRNNGNLDNGVFGYNPAGAQPSPFQNAANMMINPISPQVNPYQNQNMFPPMQPMNPMDPYMMAGQVESKKSEPASKTAEILMASLEKQNQILSELTGSINKDRDYKVVQEAKEIENKIKQMEFESQAKHYQLFNHNILDALSKNYNRPISDINLQKQSDLMPGVMPNLMSPAQLIQLQHVMGPNRFPFGGSPFSVMPSEQMKHQQKLQEKRERERKKEKKKKEKLKELLLLLGEEDGEEDEDEVVQTRKPDDGKKRGSAKKDPELKALNDEKAKLEDEKKKKKEDEAKKKRQMKLRATLWLRVYPLMYYLDFYNQKEKARIDAYGVLSERIGTNMENTKMWAIKATTKGFEMITGNAKLNLAIVAAGNKKVPPKEAEPRPAEILKIIKALMDGFINNTKADILPAQLLSFLGDITQNFMYPPQNYLFAFEIARLNFNHTASLKDTQPLKVAMICCLFIMVRMFIAEMLLQPDKVNSSVKLTDQLMRNVKTIASILVITITEFLKKSLLIQNQNQKHLDPEMVVKPRSNPINFNPPMDLKDDAGPEEEGAAAKKKDDQDIFINGLYTKEQLAVFFSKKQMADEVKALIEGWCNSIAEIVTQHHNDEVKAKMSAKLGPKK